MVFLTAFEAREWCAGRDVELDDGGYPSIQREDFTASAAGCQRT